MAHNLRTNSDGSIALAYTEGTPWHSLGTRVDGSMTAEQAIKAAGLGWTVTKEQLFRKDLSPVEGAWATIASDTNEVLGVVGDQYTPLQNDRAFDFFDALSADGSIRFSTAGALGKGEKVWMLAHTPDHVVEIVKGDPIETYLLLSNSHDGSSGVEVRSTSITVVCQNTLGMATRGAKPSVRIRHTRTVEERLRLAANIVAQHAQQQKDWTEAMQYLAKHPITDSLIHAFEVEMFGDLDSTPEGRAQTILSNKLDQFEALMLTGKGTEIPGRVGNLYGLVQAYTEWADWASPVRGTTDRSNAIVFGQAARDKQEALEFALVLAGR